MNRIKFFRKQNMMTIRDLSEKANIAIGYLSNLENNKRKNPSKEVMEKIAVALGESVPEIFYSEEE